MEAATPDPPRHAARSAGHDGGARRAASGLRLSVAPPAVLGLAGGEAGGKAESGLRRAGRLADGRRVTPFAVMTIGSEGGATSAPSTEGPTWRWPFRPARSLKVGRR